MYVGDIPGRLISITVPLCCETTRYLDPQQRTSIVKRFDASIAVKRESELIGNKIGRLIKYFVHHFIHLSHWDDRLVIPSQITRFMGPTWGPPGSCRPQMDPMLVPWTLLSGVSHEPLILQVLHPTIVIYGIRTWSSLRCRFLSTHRY